MSDADERATDSVSGTSSFMRGGLPDARRVKMLRTILKMTQEDLAHELGVTVSTVNRWENGHSRPQRLALRAMRELAAARGVALG